MTNKKDGTAQKQKGGRAFIPLDWKEIDASLMAGSSGIEIAAMLGCHHETLYNRCVLEKKKGWSEYSSEKRQKGDDLLRKAQYKNAMTGNTTMQIWLGKNRLGQKDQIVEEHTVAITHVKSNLRDQYPERDRDQPETK